MSRQFAVNSLVETAGQAVATEVTRVVEFRLD